MLHHTVKQKEIICINIKWLKYSFYVNTYIILDNYYISYDKLKKFDCNQQLQSLKFSLI